VTPDVAELQRRARKILPRHLYDYYAGGSGRERTLRASERAWRHVWFAPRVLRDVSAVTTATRLLGAAVATPLCVAPTGYQGLAHPDGEVGAAAATARAGALYVLSTRSTRRIEDVGETVAANSWAWWFQVYVMRDRGLTEGLVRRAAAAGAAALVLTADTPAVGRKRRDSGDVGVSDEDFLVNLGPLDDLTTAAQTDDVTLSDIRWLSELSGGLPVVVKGVLRADDAAACREHGAAGVIVSNHGGRQLDGALPSALALPGVATALAVQDGPGDGGASVTHPGGSQLPAEVYADGGVRTGEDALAALALGAQAVFLGRPVLWALACGGAEGVQSLIEGFTSDLVHAMTLAGVTSLAGTAGIARLHPGGWQPH
jgi:4-hydroxymandelate oxidase